MADVKQTAKPFRASLHYPEETKAAGRDQAGDNGTLGRGKKSLCTLSRTIVGPESCENI